MYVAWSPLLSDNAALFCRWLGMIQEKRFQITNVTYPAIFLRLAARIEQIIK